MEIPQALRVAIENQIIGTEQEKMLQDAQNISLRYRTKSGSGQRLLTNESEAIAYSVARMPATYGAIYNAVEESISHINCSPKTLLDAGAGTGAVTWAVDAQLDLLKVTCLEREDAMSIVGKNMMQEGSKVLNDAKWISHDLIKDEILEKADLVIVSYVLNEMTESSRLEVANNLWDATEMMLIIVEPGTPVGFSNILKIRKMLIEKGANVVSPCPHQLECPKTDNDWCHFTCRVSRTRLHRQLKGGEAPYEDEKFIYIALTKETHEKPNLARVLRHPQIRSGHVMLEICTNDGIKNIKLSKKDGEKYKEAKKAKAGDHIQYT